MNILVTGAKGFVGRNFVENLKCIRDGKNTTRPELKIDEIFEYDLESTKEQLFYYCERADFVFNLAGVNRPLDVSEFMEGNFGFATDLLNELKRHKNTCPVMLASSVQDTLTGRFQNSEYGKSKLAGEELFFKYGKDTGAKVLVYRFPNLFGKWCRPNYKDYLIVGLLDALENKEKYCEYQGVEAIAKENGKYAYIPVTHKETLGSIADTLENFKKQPETLIMPEIPAGSFAKKLYSTYLSYLPKEKVSFPLKMNIDSRGSFTELLKTVSCGQFSVNISKPGITKGEHWHNTKWEFFIVVSGKALIQERRIGTDEVLEFYVSGEKIEAVHMLPGYTHNIINLSDTEDLITLMWANESFDKNKPDTFSEKVERK